MTEALRAGSRLASAVCDTEVVVVRAPAAAVDLRCGGAPMVEPGTDRTGDPGPPHDTGTAVGKRYVSDDDGVEVLCTKSGGGSLSVGTSAMELKGAKPLPSSD